MYKLDYENGKRILKLAEFVYKIIGNDVYFKFWFRAEVVTVGLYNLNNQLTSAIGATIEEACQIIEDELDKKLKTMMVKEEWDLLTDKFRDVTYEIAAENRAIKLEQEAQAKKLKEEQHPKQLSGCSSCPVQSKETEMEEEVPF